MSYQTNRRRSRPGLSGKLGTIGVVAGALLIVAIIAGRYVLTRLDRMATTRAEAAIWDVRGPPCPTMTREAFTATFGSYAPKGMNLWETQIERRAGEVDCRLVSQGFWEGEDFMSCRFDNPIFLRVTREGQETFFRLDRGPATLHLQHEGAVRCVGSAQSSSQTNSPG